MGFASLESPRQPIADPMFTILEILIIIIMLTGLSGVVVGDMQQRNIVIVGYVGAFLVVATCSLYCSTDRPREA